jgi:hypothetical protein
MKYLEWNNLIGAHLFNEYKAGREIYLFLTRQDIIYVGRKSGFFNGQTDQTIWDSFIYALRSGLPGTYNTNLLDRLDDGLEKANRVNINGINVLFPPYLGYLILTVLPILETANAPTGDTMRANTFYPRVRDFLESNNLPDLPNPTQTRNWNHIWQHLSNWSIQTKKTEAGIFYVRNFSAGWKYAGIPLSQCLIDPRALKLLPEVFLREGLVPNNYVSDGEWRTLLEKTWVKDLRQHSRVLAHIRQEDDEMGKVVLEIVKQVYARWHGETEVEEETSPSSPIKRIRKAGIRARLFLAFKLEKSTYDLKWGCRMYSQNDYPEDLLFGETTCYEVRENWSNQLELGFLEKASLKDTANKWEAVLPEKDLRLFIGGATLSLNSDFWVETDQMSRISLMRLLCKNSLRKQIESWSKHFQPPGRFKELTGNDCGGIPEGWSLFEFQYPKESIEGEPATYLPTNKKILLVGGVKIGYRTWQKSCMPEVLIENGDGSEEVFIERTTGGDKIHLQKKFAGDTRWLLPDLQAGNEFQVSTNEEKTFFKIASEKLDALNLDNSLCPKRNRFGMVDEIETSNYVQGSLVQGFDFTRQHVYKSHFQPGQRTATFEPSQNQFSFDNDVLLEFLTRKKSAHSSDFFEAYENILSKRITGELDETGVNLTSLKRQVLNLYDFLGYVDFDYQSKRVVANPTQLFLIPTECGRKALLTGARTPDFVERAFEKVRQLGLHLKVVPQGGAKERWVLLPDTLFVEAQDLPAYGMAELNAFATDLNIYYDPDHITQWGLLNFSAGLDDYEKSLITDERFEDYDWSRKIFNPRSFRFERMEDEFFDKTFSLVEYQHNAYTYHHILWRDGVAYPVDKSWGRWLVLKHHKQQVVFYGRNGVTAIPAGMPLPRLISEALLLCSGQIPEQKFLEVNGIKTIFSLYGNVVEIMLHNEFSRIGQKPVHVNQIF